MREQANGVGLAVPFSVPIVADSVLGPRLAYGSMPILIEDSRLCS